MEDPNFINFLVFFIYSQIAFHILLKFFLKASAIVLHIKLFIQAIPSLNELCYIRPNR